MDPVSFATFLIGYFGQYAKAHPKIPAWTIDIVQWGVGFGCFLLSHPIVADYPYWRDAILFAFSLPGLSSVAGHTGLAPKTT